MKLSHKCITFTVQAIISVYILLYKLVIDITEVIFSKLLDLRPVDPSALVSPFELTCLSLESALDKLCRMPIFPEILGEQMDVARGVATLLIAGAVEFPLVHVVEVLGRKAWFVRLLDLLDTVLRIAD